MLKDVAREHRLGLGVVHQLVKKARTNKDFLGELVNERDEVR